VSWPCALVFELEEQCTSQAAAIDAIARSYSDADQVTNLTSGGVATASGLNTSGNWHDRRHLSDRPSGRPVADIVPTRRLTTAQYS